MSLIEFWPDLPRAWEATSDTRSESATVTTAGGRWRVIKSESRARVVWLEADGFLPVVCKIYRTPRRLAWRTYGIASRANREFTVMMKAHRLGLPVVRPGYWLEHRVRGRVSFSALTLEAIESTDLESWLLAEEGDRDKRLQMAGSVGRLLCRFHREGLFWGTVSVRNLLLPRGGGEPLLAIDLPYARLYGRDIRGNKHAMMDLAIVLQLSDGHLAFDEGEREALMLGYCEGDANGAQALNAHIRLFSHKAWKRQRFLRRLGNLFSSGTKSAGRGGAYCRETGEYRPLDSRAVILDWPVG
jgi:tRNA A-37 threonylcarbamoyl transferase component Bud32